jgi:hypothetical protein
MAKTTVDHVLIKQHKDSTNFQYERFELFIAQATHITNNGRKSLIWIIHVIIFTTCTKRTFIICIGKPINAQAFSSGSTSSGNSTISESHVTQMGICVVGAGGPCNADSNWDGIHDVSGKCVLLNGCRNDNGIGNNNKNTNNIVSGR